VIVGSGLLAHAFDGEFSRRSDICIYTAGVSNSNCVDPNEFTRERKRLEEALRQANGLDAFVYFGTCSVADPMVRDTPYVQHKLAMEDIVRMHPRNLVLRLPQVAGKTQNPHTLLNYLYARIVRGEVFNLWSGAKRNIIDVFDVAALAKSIISDHSMRDTVLNVANIANYPVVDIVSVMERVIGKNAHYHLIDRRSEYSIDIDALMPFVRKAGIAFEDDYLFKVIEKYYGN
jgi:hypothetical protein